ncbi:hypothetical protein HYS72_02525 [Candidatus Pacearchaeota archaeon]|nr:hypothetical protein [Candidatus Pacearchaeota archaeon]MBI2056652.1 hypothetical protein [Candidatus Pacearchaeota archaeon]
MKKIIFVLFVVLFLNLSLVSAISEQEIGEAKSLIDSKISCDDLTDEQLEIMGEYYMEQMHPGEAHELMHKMMGLTEGSEDEEKFHINMAKIIYCGESSGNMISSGSMMGGGMMDMMSGGNMMGSGGMMGSSNFGYWNFLNILYLILLIGIIILIILWIIKLLKEIDNKNLKGGQEKK